MNTLVLVLRHSIENSSNHCTEMVEYIDLLMLQYALSELPFEMRFKTNTLAKLFTSTVDMTMGLICMKTKMQVKKILIIVIFLRFCMKARVDTCAMSNSELVDASVVKIKVKYREATRTYPSKSWSLGSCET